MIQSISSNWNFFRGLRLALGVFIIIQGIVSRDSFSVLIGTLFGGMALFNVGCCGTAGCASNIDQNVKPNTTEEIKYEEVKNEK